MSDTPSGNDSLPASIVESIAIANAKSIGEQPAILANLALANQILNDNLRQQMAILQQQAMNQLVMATMARCVELLASGGLTPEEIAASQKILESLTTLTPPGSPSPGQPSSPPEESPTARSTPSAQAATARTAASSIPEDVLKSLSIANVSSVGTQPAALANLAFANLVQNLDQVQQNAVSTQQAMNVLQTAILSRLVTMLTRADRSGANGDKRPPDAR